MKKFNIIISLLVAFFFFSNLQANIPEGEEYLAFAEQMPAPEGGLKAIYSNVKYPEIAQKAGLQGKVYVMAFINENGGVDDVKVIKGLGGGCDEAAVTAVKEAKFTPGMAKGKPVKVKYALPITFKLK